MAVITRQPGESWVKFYRRKKVAEAAANGWRCEFCGLLPAGSVPLHGEELAYYCPRLECEGICTKAGMSQEELKLLQEPAPQPRPERRQPDQEAALQAVLANILHGRSGDMGGSPHPCENCQATIKSGNRSLCLECSDYPRQLQAAVLATGYQPTPKDTWSPKMDCQFVAHLEDRTYRDGEEAEGPNRKRYARTGHSLSAKERAARDRENTRRRKKRREKKGQSEKTWKMGIGPDGKLVRIDIATGKVLQGVTG